MKKEERVLLILLFLVIIPSVSASYSVILNSGTGLTCSQLCSPNSCVSAGTDSAGTNNNYITSSCSTSSFGSYPCTTAISSARGSCLSWTNCRCSSGSCTSQCTQGSIQCIDSVNYKSCGDYNSDGCTEWSSVTTPCPSGKTCSGNACGSQCTPKTCSDLGKECGQQDNGCGTIINCGTCSSGLGCDQSGRCVANPCLDECSKSGLIFCSKSNQAEYLICGNYDSDSCLEWSPVMKCWTGQICSYTQQKCVAGSCTSKTCSQLGKQCGVWNNGCGTNISCGTCLTGKTCTNGACVCAPQTCFDLGKECGIWNNGCGANITCGDCSSGYACNSTGQCVFNKEINCTDGIDNDNDGFIDCEDSDCKDDKACLACPANCGECGKCDDGSCAVDSSKDTEGDCRKCECEGNNCSIVPDDSDVPLIETYSGVFSPEPKKSFLTNLFNFLTGSAIADITGNAVQGATEKDPCKTCDKDDNPANNPDGSECTKNKINDGVCIFGDCNDRSGCPKEIKTGASDNPAYLSPSDAKKVTLLVPPDPDAGWVFYKGSGKGGTVNLLGIASASAELTRIIRDMADKSAGNLNCGNCKTINSWNDEAKSKIMFTSQKASEQCKRVEDFNNIHFTTSVVGNDINSAEKSLQNSIQDKITKLSPCDGSCSREITKSKVNAATLQISSNQWKASADVYVDVSCKTPTDKSLVPYVPFKGKIGSLWKIYGKTSIRKFCYK